MAEGEEFWCRPSEICQFTFEDLQHHGNNKHALLLRHSKTDQDSGYILRSFKRNLSTNPSLTPASINHILKILQKKAGLNQIGELSGHSFRVGAALDQLD